LEGTWFKANKDRVLRVVLLVGIGAAANAVACVQFLEFGLLIFRVWFVAKECTYTSSFCN